MFLLKSMSKPQHRCLRGQIYHVGLVCCGDFTNIRDRVCRNSRQIWRRYRELARHLEHRLSPALTSLHFDLAFDLLRHLCLFKTAIHPLWLGVLLIMTADVKCRAGVTYGFRFVALFASQSTSPTTMRSLHCAAVIRIMEALNMAFFTRDVKGRARTLEFKIFGLRKGALTLPYLLS